MDTGGSFPGVKRPGREADHSPPSSAEVKNTWSYTSTPPIRLHGVVLSSTQGQLYFYIIIIIIIIIINHTPSWKRNMQYFIGKKK
jgi:hypothetical protein